MAAQTKKTTTGAAATEEKTEVKVYHFTSKKKFLTCAGLGVQFMDGKASTDNLEVARALAKIDGVELVEG
ncbi:MAG: hypothetical protein ACLVD8_17730 [Enterocloster sp.]|uniref:hypothetical protein n=1 Tax=Enterocloster sp. TaxID=2719315 RepID=UPI0002082123|nr:hypothetical protein HMPREF1025_01352 [Lachnospiraceae bacterium 3_1_46FAA]